ncbi:MAG: aryl-sulfate sulfotransferase [Planctomycetaceae bacterium]
MQRRRRKSVVQANTPVEVLEDRQLLTGIDYGDATVLKDQGHIPGPELRDLNIEGEGIAVYPAFSPDQLRYGVTPSEETDKLVINPVTRGDDQVRVNGRLLTEDDNDIALRDLSDGETIQVEVFSPDDPTDVRNYEIIYLPEIYTLDVTLNEHPDENPGSIYVTPRGPGGNYLAKIDHNGVPEFIQTETPVTGGIGPQIRLADFKRHENGLYSYFYSHQTNEFDRVDYVARIGEMVETDAGLEFRILDEVETQGEHMNHTDFHDILVTDDTYVVIAYNGEIRDGDFYEDSVIQVLDRETKEILVEWNSKNDIGLLVGKPGSYVLGDPGTGYDDVSRVPEYAHINSVFMDDNGDIIASLRFTSSIVKIDGTTGELLWHLGGRHSDWEIDDPWGGPCGQHTAQINSKGNLIYFDNGTPCPDVPEYSGRPAEDSPEARMRYVEYELDEETMTATLVREIVHPDYAVGPTGSVQELPGDHVLVSWGFPGRSFANGYSTIEYDENDQPIREYSFDRAFSYRAHYALDNNYPTLAEDNGASHTIVDGMFLGSGVDADEDGQPSTSSGDDIDFYYDDDGNLVNDEDGVVFTSDIVPGTLATVDVEASTAGVLNAWFDFNYDGDWLDDGEQIFTDISLSEGINSLAFGVPASAVTTETFTRFRFSSEEGLAPTGHASDGEVEDHKVEITTKQAQPLENDTGDTKDIFGDKVAISGRYAAVAAPNAGSRRTGKVDLYFREDDGSWVKVKSLESPDRSNDLFGGDRFGWSVSLHQGTLVVGSPREENGAADKSSGAAYIFQRDKGGRGEWGLVQRLRAADFARGDHFGSSVSVDGDTIAVGARLDDGPRKQNTGSVYVFKQKTGGFWQQIRHVFDPNAARNDQFGFSVDVEGNNMIAGAPNVKAIVETPEGPVEWEQSGRVYVYRREGEQWDLQQQVDAPDVGNNFGAGDQFGRSVAIYDSLAVVGAHAEEEFESSHSSGAAYVLRRNAGGKDNWGVARKLTASDPAIRDQFGYSVDIHRGRVAVGARTKRADDGVLKAGAVFLFDRLEGKDSWYEVQKFQAPDASPRDYTGHSVALFNAYTITGAPLNDDQGVDSGKAYVYFAGQDSPLTASGQPVQTVHGNLTTAELRPIVEAATAQWADGDLTRRQQDALARFTVSIGDLEPGRLGQASRTSIVIDSNAAGFGWYVDPTPFDLNDDEIGPRMDLLTTVAHEIGHVLGHADLSDAPGDIMYERLAAGERRTFEAQLTNAVETEVDSLFAMPEVSFDVL